MKKDLLLNEYISSVSSLIICPSKQKKAFLAELSSDVEGFLAENKNATKEDVEKIFGTPESIATSFISNADSVKIKRKLSIKNIIILAVILALLIYLAFAVISLIDVHAEAHGYFEEGIVPAIISVMKGCAL
ncbi:MAG: hypothetical protein E7538_07870 [Ruminococcaceae bacterium]|nr:hypothetical protein [Oscillospiraceae bacterium]